MYLPSFTKIVSRSVQWSSSFVKTFSYEREPFIYIYILCYVIMNKKKDTCISSDFNGFKFIYTHEL